MRCDEIQDRLSTALDGELPAAERAEVDRHLAACASCRDVLHELQALDARFRRATLAVRDRAPEVAAAALSRLSGHESSSLRPQSWGAALRRNLLVASVAMACGFLLAVLVFAPSRPAVRPVEPDSPPLVADRPPDAPPPAPAVIRAATGPVEVAGSSADAWTAIERPDGFACQPGVAVRTTDASVCELETAGGATVRMNAATELAFINSDNIELSHGEIWCRTPDASGLKVTPTAQGAAAAAPISLVCGPDGPASCVFTCPAPDDPTRISVASGRVDVLAPDHTQPVDAGRSVEVRDGMLQPVSGDGVLADRWMHPLLVRKGPADSELAARVNALLAEVGRTKVSYLCERDLRSLGEYGALPLLRFLQSDANHDDAARRRTAAEILADVVPAWMTPELIDLLADADPAVRVSVAGALQRLTGETLGMTAESWGDPDRDLGPAIAEWRAWWQSQRQAYPAPPAGVTL